MHSVGSLPTAKGNKRSKTTATLSLRHHASMNNARHTINHNSSSYIIMPLHLKSALERYVMFYLFVIFSVFLAWKLQNLVLLQWHVHGCIGGVFIVFCFHFHHFISIKNGAAELSISGFDELLRDWGSLQWSCEESSLLYITCYITKKPRLSFT